MLAKQILRKSVQFFKNDNLNIAILRRTIKTSLSVLANQTISSKNEPRQLLRKLGGSERFYVNVMDEHCNFMNSRCLLIESKIDLYDRIDLLQKAIDQWKQSHHFLKANIVKNEENGDLCFAYAQRHLLENSDNVKILTFEPNGNMDADYWQHIFKREFNMTIDSYNSLLWRLLVIKSNSSKDGQYEYRLIFSANHSIVDGRNAISILSQLVGIIEKVYMKVPVKLEPYDVLPPHHLHDSVQKHGLKQTDLSHDDHASFKIPDGFTYDENKPVQSVYDSNGIFLNHDKTPYVSMSDIIKLNYNGFTEISYLRFDKNVIVKLLEICKQNGCKLTGCMNIITVLGTQQMLLNYSKTPNCADHISYGFTVDNRQFLVPRVEPTRMGYCSLLFDTHFKELHDLNKPGFWSKKFWRFVKEESDLIHLRLKRGDNLNIARNDESFELQLSDMGSSIFHFVIANRGDMTKISNTEFGKLKIIEHFNSMSFGHRLTPNLFFHSLDSIDKNLAWSFTYNNRIVHENAAKFLGNFIQDTVVALTKL